MSQSTRGVYPRLVTLLLYEEMWLRQLESDAARHCTARRVRVASIKILPLQQTRSPHVSTDHLQSTLPVYKMASFVNSRSFADYYYDFVSAKSIYDHHQACGNYFWSGGGQKSPPFLIYSTVVFVLLNNNNNNNNNQPVISIAYTAYCYKANQRHSTIKYIRPKATKISWSLFTTSTVGNC